MSQAESSSEREEEEEEQSSSSSSSEEEQESSSSSEQEDRPLEEWDMPYIKKRLRELSDFSADGVVDIEQWREFAESLVLKMEQDQEAATKRRKLL